MELSKFVGIFQDKAHQGFGAHHVSVVLKDDKTHKEISDFKIEFNVSEEKISIIFVEQLLYFN